MWALFHESSLWIPASVLVAGFIGSPHCLSMCGPLVANFSRQKSELWAYQIGRGSAYALAGAVAGGLGQTVLSEERSQVLTDLSLLLIALLLVVNGYRAVMNKPLHFKVPAWLTRISMFLWSGVRASRSSRWPPSVTAAAAGVLTVFLPCGHLYTFLVGSVATGHAAAGALFMTAFWLGSTPLLSFSAMGMQRFLRSRDGQRQRWAGGILVVAGIFSVLAFGARTDLLGRPNPMSPHETQRHEQAGICR